MKKIIWTVLIGFVLASLPVSGTAFAGQGHPGKHALTKSEKHGKKARQAKRQHHRKMVRKALKHGHKHV